jgi:hypothetical protein
VKITKVETAQPRRIAFWHMLWLLMKRGPRNYLHVFMVYGEEGHRKLIPCFGPLDWPEARIPKVGEEM